MKLNQFAIDIKYLALGPFAKLYFQNEPNPFEDLETFCCFVGHGRSGGTLVGALLNAHPDVVISNEFHALSLLRKRMPFSQMLDLIYVSSRRQVGRGSLGGGGYSYAIENQWQGKHRNLKVIGVRKAGKTAMEIFEYPWLLDRFEAKVHLKKKFIHVARNPFDCISTTFHKTRRFRNEGPDSHLKREIGRYFVRCESVDKVVEKFGPDSLEVIHLEHISSDPVSEIGKLCDFLELDAPGDYLESCAEIVNSKPNESRRTIEWSHENMELVMHNAKRFPWLSEYRF